MLKSVKNVLLYNTADRIKVMKKNIFSLHIFFSLACSALAWWTLLFLWLSYCKVQTFGSQMEKCRIQSSVTCRDCSLETSWDNPSVNSVGSKMDNSTLLRFRVRVFGQYISLLKHSCLIHYFTVHHSKIMDQDKNSNGFFLLFAYSYIFLWLKLNACAWAVPRYSSKWKRVALASQISH